MSQHYRKAVTLQCQLFFEGRDIENIDSRAASIGLQSLRNLEEDKGEVRQLLASKVKYYSTFTVVATSSCLFLPRYLNFSRGY